MKSTLCLFVVLFAAATQALQSNEQLAMQPGDIYHNDQIEYVDSVKGVDGVKMQVAPPAGATTKMQKTSESEQMEQQDDTSSQPQRMPTHNSAVPQAASDSNTVEPEMVLMEMQPGDVYHNDQIEYVDSVKGIDGVKMQVAPPAGATAKMSKSAQSEQMEQQDDTSSQPQRSSSPHTAAVPQSASDANSFEPEMVLMEMQPGDIYHNDQIEYVDSVKGVDGVKMQVAPPAGSSPSMTKTSESEQMEQQDDTSSQPQRSSTPHTAAVPQSASDANSVEPEMVLMEMQPGDVYHNDQIEYVDSVKGIDGVKMQVAPPAGATTRMSKSAQSEQMEQQDDTSSQPQRSSGPHTAAVPQSASDANSVEPEMVFVEEEGVAQGEMKPGDIYHNEDVEMVDSISGLGQAVDSAPHRADNVVVSSSASSAPQATGGNVEMEQRDDTSSTVHQTTVQSQSTSSSAFEDPEMVEALPTNH